jgi:hypothetical protein
LSLCQPLPLLLLVLQLVVVVLVVVLLLLPPALPPLQPWLSPSPPGALLRAYAPGRGQQQR